MFTPRDEQIHQARLGQFSYQLQDLTWVPGVQHHKVFAFLIVLNAIIGSVNTSKARVACHWLRD